MKRNSFLLLLFSGGIIVIFIIVALWIISTMNMTSPGSSTSQSRNNNIVSNTNNVIPSNQTNTTPTNTNPTTNIPTTNIPTPPPNNNPNQLGTIIPNNNKFIIKTTIEGAIKTEQRVGVNYVYPDGRVASFPRILTQEIILEDIGGRFPKAFIELRGEFNPRPGTTVPISLTSGARNDVYTSINSPAATYTILIKQVGSAPNTFLSIYNYSEPSGGNVIVAPGVGITIVGSSIVGAANVATFQVTGPNRIERIGTAALLKPIPGEPDFI